MANNGLPDPTNIDEFVRTVLRGDTGLVMYYLMEGDVEDSNEEGLTPITALLIRGSLLPRDQMTDAKQEEILDVFINSGVSLDNPDANGNFPIFAAVFANFPVALKVFNNADTTVINPHNSVNLVMTAAGLGLEDVIRFISPDFNLDAKDDDGNTAVHHAVIADRQVTSRMQQAHPRDIVSTLCELGADASLENNAGKTPYELATDAGKYDVALIVKHCSLPKEGFHKIKIKLNPDAEESDFYVHDQDTVLEVKRAILFEDANNFNFLFPRFREQPVMDNMRAISDYGMRDGDLVTVMPKLRTGRGGKRRRTTQKRRALKRRGTRRN
jgi:hypothetical protein